MTTNQTGRGELDGQLSLLDPGSLGEAPSGEAASWQQAAQSTGAGAAPFGASGVSGDARPPQKGFYWRQLAVLFALAAITLGLFVFKASDELFASGPTTTVFREPPPTTQPAIRPGCARDGNCRDAPLKGRVFRGIDLSGVDFTDANLRDANLQGTDLSGAVLTGADLRGADLRDADLTGARFSGALASGSTVWPRAFAKPLGVVNTPDPAPPTTSPSQSPISARPTAPLLSPATTARFVVSAQCVMRTPRDWIGTSMERWSMELYYSDGTQGSGGQSC